MSEPDTAMAAGLSPEMSEALTVAPEVVYSPIVWLLLFEIKGSEPRAPLGTINSALTTRLEKSARETGPRFAYLRTSNWS